MTTGEGAANTRRDVLMAARGMARPSAAHSLGEIALIWSQIAVAMAVFWFLRNPVVYVAVLLFVGARQYALLVLLHDAQHTLLAKTEKLNHFVAQWTIAAPCGTIFISSRQAHLDHHNNLADPVKDPAYHIYCGEQPWPKRRAMDFIRFYVYRVVGSKFHGLLFAKKGPDAAGAAPAGPGARLVGVAHKLAPLAVCQVVIAIVLGVAFQWYAWAYLWFLPLITLVVLFDDFRQFAEHANLGENPTKWDDILITYRSNPVERFFFAPKHMNFHAEHHFFPFVPHWRLPELRREIERTPELRDRIQWRGSYVGHLLRYLKACAEREAGAGKSSQAGTAI